MGLQDWTEAEHSHVRREVALVMAASNAVALSVLGIAIGAWATGSGPLFGTFVAAYVGMCVLVAFTAGIPRKKQQRRDLEWAERLRHIANHDELSGLHNRRYFNSALEQTIAEGRRRGGLVRMAVVDLDGFKRINDTWGHAAGDVAIRTAAAALRDAAAPGMVVARIGGDEFAVLVAGMDETSDEAIRERLQGAIASAPFLVEVDLRAPIGATVGVARLRPGMDGDGLMRAADAALYGAKGPARPRRGETSAA